MGRRRSSAGSRAPKVPPRPERDASFVANPDDAAVQERGAGSAARRTGGPALALALLVAAGVAVGLAGGRLFGDRREASEPPRPVPTAHAGPWGELAISRMLLAAPEDVITDDCAAGQPAWQLPGMARMEVAALLAGTSVERATRERWLATASCTEQPRGCTLEPTVEEVAALPANARAALYGVLGRFRQNPRIYFHFRLLASELDGWMASSGLAPPLQARMRELIWSTGDSVHFVDVPVLCREVPDAEHVALLRTLTRVPSLALELRVAPHADTSALAAWWKTPSRPDVPAILQSLASMPEGGSIDVGHLLPPLPRSWLFRHPSRAEPPRDCHWTSMNFGAEEADDRWLDLENVRRSLATDYRVVPREEARLGDVVVLSDPDDDLLHSAVYVADDVVLTKNGQSARKPWVLMTLGEVLAEYGYRTGTQYAFHRRR